MDRRRVRHSQSGKNDSVARPFSLFTKTNYYVKRKSLFNINKFILIGRDRVARITIEDCLEKVNNRFALIQLAFQRVKQLRNGAPRLVQTKNKEVVGALREIAAGHVNADNINQLHHNPEVHEQNLMF